MARQSIRMNVKTIRQPRVSFNKPTMPKLAVRKVSNGKRKA